MRYCGFSLRKELQYLQGALQHPRRPIAAIIGGAKVSSKIHLLENLVDKFDKIFIGGAMVFTFYHALGHEIGDSFVESEMMEEAAHILHKSTTAGNVVTLATDVVVASTEQVESQKQNKDEQSNPLTTQVVGYDVIPPHHQGLDIGPESLRVLETEVHHCPVIIWNGPLGKIEDDQFKTGTNEVIRILSECTNRGQTTIACGGDTIFAIENAPRSDFSHLSMGGGAALALLSGNVLPGVDVLSTNTQKLAEK